MARLCPITNNVCQLTGCLNSCTMQNQMGVIDYRPASKGWQCPKCERIWSPNISECLKCNLTPNTL